MDITSLPLLNNVDNALPANFTTPSSNPASTNAHQSNSTKMEYVSASQDTIEPIMVPASPASPALNSTLNNSVASPSVQSTKLTPTDSVSAAQDLS